MCGLRRKLNRGTGRASPAQDEGQGSASVQSLSLMPRVPDFGGHGHLRWGSSNRLPAARVSTLRLALGLGESPTTSAAHPCLPNLAGTAQRPPGPASEWVLFLPGPGKALFYTMLRDPASSILALLPCCCPHPPTAPHGHTQSFLDRAVT